MPFSFENVDFMVKVLQSKPHTTECYESTGK